MKTKAIENIIYAPQHAMGDMMVRQPLPSQELPYLDPFVLLHHGINEIPEDFHQNHEGVGPHPHRGFAPVTFVFEGGVHHQDSRGNKGTVLKGGVQWMNAGMGIIHSERPAVPGTQEIIQMWVNMPKKNKKDQPSYYPLTNEDTPKYVTGNGLVEAGVVSGELFGIKGPIPTLSPINSAMVRASKGGKLEFTIPEGHHSFLYLLAGNATVNGLPVNKFHQVVFSSEGDAIEIQFQSDSKALFMTGEPIGEEIVAKGPFVVNDEIEVMEAYRDYRMGKMGILIEE